MFGTILVLIGTVLAAVSAFSPDSRYRPFILPLGVFLIGLGVLLGADALVNISTSGSGK